MTIIDKLNQLLQTKTLIKEALIAKGVEISDTDSFDSYVGKIENITSGRANIPAGVVYWIDGQCNTRNGKDHTKNYMENLIWNNTGSSTNGYLEKLNNGSDNYWDGDYLTLGNYAYYPYVYSNNLTIESLIKINKTPTTSIIWASCASQGGWYLLVTTDNKILFGVHQGSSYTTITSDVVLDLNTPYYVVATFEANNQLTLRLCNVDGSLQTTASTTVMTYKLSNFGMGTQSYASSSSSDKHWDGLQIGMVRVWNKNLTDKEIQANYEETKNRFKEDTTGIPSVFTELEYLEKNVQDNSYIDLEYKANITTTTELEFSANSWVNDANYNPQIIFGAMNGDTSDVSYDLLAFCEATNTPSVRIVRGASLGTTTRVNSLVVNPNQKYKFRLGPESLTIDDTLIDTYSERNDITTTNLYMFRVNASLASSSINTYYSNAKSCAVGKLYTLKIYEGETLVRDYIPVQRKDNLVYGLFDKVARTFLPVSVNSSFTGIAK